MGAGVRDSLARAMTTNTSQPRVTVSETVGQACTPSQKHRLVALSADEYTSSMNYVICLTVVRETYAALSARRVVY